MDYLTKKQQWLDSLLVSDEEKDYIRKADDDTLREMFASPLAFGTGGMRALLGPGCSRLNLLTVRRATIGVGKFLLSKYGPDACKKRGFAISFDNRHMSKEFRDCASKVLTEMGYDRLEFFSREGISIDFLYARETLSDLSAAYVEVVDEWQCVLRLDHDGIRLTLAVVNGIGAEEAAYVALQTLKGQA